MLTSKRHQHFSSYISRLVDCPKKAKMSKIKDMLTTSNTGNEERMEVSQQQQSTPVENESTSPSSSSSATMTTRSTRRQRITINNMLQTTSTTTTTTTKSNYESDLAAMKEAIIRELAVEEQHVDVKQEAVDVLEEEMTDYYHQMQQQYDEDDEDDNGDDAEEGQGDEDADFEPPLSPRDDCESSSRRRRYPVRNSPNRYNHRRINSNPNEESLSNEEESGVKIKPKIQIKLAISEKKERKRPGPQKKPKINEIIAIQNKQQRQNSPEPTDLETTGEDGKAKKSANYELLATARKLAKLEAVLHNNERRPGAPRRPKISEMICPNSEITQQELEQYQQQYQQHNDQEKQSKSDEQAAANSNAINENPQEEVVESEPKRKKAGAPKRAKISEIVAAAEKAASLTQLSTNGTETTGPIKCHLNKSSTERISDLIRSSTITSSQTTITTPVATSQPAQLGESTATATNKPTTNTNSKMTRKIIDILTSQQQLQEQQLPFAGGRSSSVQQRENAVKSSASSESKSASDKILSKTPISQIMRAVNNNNGPLKPTATNLLEKRALPQPPPSTATTKSQSTTTTTSSRKINNYLYGDDPEKRPTMNQGRLLISDILNRNNNTNTNTQNTQQTGKSTISSMLTISMLNNNNTITNSTNNSCITASTLSVADTNKTTSEPTKKRGNVEDEGLEEGEVYVKSEPVVIERDENLERAHDLMMLSGAMICARCERCFVPSIEQLQQIQQQSSTAAGSSPLGNKINKMTTNDDYDNIGLCPDCSSCSKRNQKHN